MPQYLVAIHHPGNYDPSCEDQATGRDIDVLNEVMMAAGVRIFAGGLRPASSAKSLRVQPGGKVLITDEAVPGDQGAHRRFLDTGSRRHGRGAGVGRKAAGAGRGTPVLLTQNTSKGLAQREDYSMSDREDERSRAQGCAAGFQGCRPIEAPALPNYEEPSPQPLAIIDDSLATS